MKYKIKRYPGERAAIRFFDSDRKEDMVRLRKIIDCKDVRDRMDSVARMSKRDMYDWADEKGSYGRYYLFAVSGTEEVFGESSKQIGEVQGFVYLYAGSEERKIIERIVKAGLIKKSRLGKRRVFEISFAKLPRTKKGQIGSAVRQACMELSRLDKKKGGKGAFVYCFIDESNDGSIRVVESCGFVRKGRHFYEEDSRDKSALFVLSYKKLREIEKNKAKG